MSPKLKKVFAPTLWIFYLVIGIEIIYMISPIALYYYSSYGPSLNFLHQSAATAWLTSFFLPHYVKTSSFVLNTYPIFGWIFIVAGFVLFLVGAVPIYYSKLTRKGAVTGGLYRFVRHPQYTAFAIMGFGLLLAWPRFTVLVIYVTMLFAYYFLAKKEERDCEQKFGDSYTAYKAKTAMFFPGMRSLLRKVPSLPSKGWRKGVAISGIYLSSLTLAILAAFALREFSLSALSATYSPNSATIAADVMDESEIRMIVEIAYDVPEVRNRLSGFANGSSAKYLNYVVPQEWYLPDVPMEKIPQGLHGHHQPSDYDRSRYKVLITEARLTSSPASGKDILRKTYGRKPILLVKVDTEKRQVTDIETPPPFVRWGDIPTPLF